MELYASFRIKVVPEDLSYFVSVNTDCDEMNVVSVCIDFSFLVDASASFFIVCTTKICNSRTQLEWLKNLTFHP